ncbi:aldo/keto reductase [Streptomyces sp. NPDC013157]|uniref:aldo/keto reductase n=1 Tax=Streptomyces sp. NPDC013157 TaxID=3364861 RepID=UPI003685CA7D
MAHRSWLVFGLEGRSTQDVRDAVDLGYRRFDAAEGYGRTTDELAEAVRDSGVDREGIEVLYRFDVRADESRADLKARLQEVAARFDGRLDAAVIGNLDAPEEQVKEAWAVLGELKEEGTVREAGVAGVAPRHANLLVDLRQEGRVGVVDFAPEAAGRGQGAAEGWRKNLLDALGGEEDLRYYKVVRALGELLGRAAQTPQQVGTPQASQGPPAPYAPYPSYPSQVPARSTPTPASASGIVLRNDDTPLPDGVRDLLVPLYEEPERLRAEVRAHAAGGAVDREAVSRWLMEERGFTREELEGLTVPDRVGLRGEYRDLRLADVLAGHLGPNPREQAVAHELGYALLHDADTWKEVRPALNTVAYPPGPSSVAEAAALRGVNTESLGRGPTRGREEAAVRPPSQIASVTTSRTL